MANLKLTGALTYRYHFISQFMGTCVSDCDKEIFHYHFSEFLLLWCTDDIKEGQYLDGAKSVTKSRQKCCKRKLNL